MDAEATREIAIELQKYPENTTLQWGDTHTKINKNLHRASWVDVYIPEICKKLGYNWLVTIIDPATWDEETEQAWPIHPESALILEKPSGTLWTLQGSGEVEYNNPTIILTKYKETPNSEELAHLEKEADRTGLLITETPYWTNETLNNVLHRWTYGQTGRNDITFSYSKDIGENLTKEISERIEGQEMFKIDENIEVTSETFQKLLELPPEEAAGIIKKIKEAAEHFKKNQ